MATVAKVLVLAAVHDIRAHHRRNRTTVQHSSVVDSRWTGSIYCEHELTCEDSADARRVYS